MTKLVQYAEQFGGYMPARGTHPILPAGSYSVANSQAGLYFLPQPVTNDNLVSMPDSVATDVIEEVSDFWGKGEVYKKLGIAHKRGYLLYGPPGSGKTSTIAEIRKGIIAAGGVMLFVNENLHLGLTSLLLRDFREVEPERNVVVVFEDIDAIIEKCGEATVLSLLDGPLSIDHVVYIATTNYLDKLEKRIADRPSRFDKVVYVGMPSENDRRAYLAAKTFGDVEPDRLDHWAHITDGFSVAHLKETIVGVYGLGETITEAVERVRNMGKVVGSSSRKVGFGA